MRLAIIAGESSGDLLGAGLVGALRQRSDGDLQLLGVGGPALEAEGLDSMFDFTDIAIMGISAVLTNLPKLTGHIRRTAAAIIEARPDALVIVDSPGFTHRVAKKVREALPDLPIVQYVCPTVWAWKEYRAQAMVPYVDHVLAILPFEPAAMKRLGGPPTTYVGHRLRDLPAMQTVRADRQARSLASDGTRTIVLLPGSRVTEISRLLPVFEETATILCSRGSYRFLIRRCPHQEARIREMTANWAVRPEVITGEAGKWSAFGEADAALAAAGTVLFELALAGVPAVAAYKTDIFIRFIRNRIKTWTAALPNLVVDYPLMPEFYDEFARAGMLARWMEHMSSDTPQRRAMLSGYDDLYRAMTVERPSNDLAADVVLDLVAQKNPA